MSKANITPLVQDPQESINKLQALSQELQAKNSHVADNSLYYLNQTAIQNFILSCQEQEGSKSQTKEILSQIELDFLDHLRQKNGLDSQEFTPLSNNKILIRNATHKGQLDLLREEVKGRIEEYSKEISTVAPYQSRLAEDEAAFPPTFKAQEIYKYSSEGIKSLTKDLIEESKADLANAGITLGEDIKYVISCFGSLARDEASPYSDLEFGVLLEDNLSEEKLEETKQYFRNLTDLLNIKVINLGETTATIQDIKEVKDLSLKLPIKNGFSFDGNALGGCKTPLGNKRAIVKRIEEVNQNKVRNIEFINSNNSLSQTQKDERITEISKSINKRISKLKEDEYELIMTPSQMAQFHNETWYKRDRHLSTVLYTTDMLQASNLEGGHELLESYTNETNKILNKEIEIDELSEEEQERRAIELSQISIEDNTQPLTLRNRRAFNLLEEAVGKFEPKAGRDQDSGKSFSPKYDFYRPATMLIDHLSYLYNIGNRYGEKSVWERFDRLFVNNAPLALGTERNPNIEGINNLRWMIDRTLQIRLKNYMAKENQNEDMILLDEYKEEERKQLAEKGLGISQEEVFEVYYVMMIFYLRMQNFTEKRCQDKFIFFNELYCDNSDFIKAFISNLLLENDKAVDYYESFLRTVRKDGNQENIAIALNNLGSAYAMIANHPRKIKLLEESLTITEKIFGHNHPSVANSLYNLGNSHIALGNHHKGVELLEKSLEIKEKIFGRNHSLVADSLDSLGNAHGALGNFQKIKEFSEEALKIREKIFGRNHQDVASSLFMIGNAHGALGNYQKKIEFLEEALEIKEKIFGHNHPSVAFILNNLGNAHGILGDTPKQIELLEESLRITKKIFGRYNPDVANSLNNLGIAHGVLGNHKKEVEFLEESLEIREKIFGRNHPSVADSLDNLGNAHGALGDTPKRIELLEESLTITEKIFGRNHPSVAETLNNLGNAHGALGNYQKKIEFLEEAITIKEEIFGHNHPSVANSLYNLGNAHGALGDYQKMIELLEESLTITEKIFGRNHPSVAETLNNLGNVHRALGNHHKAFKILTEAIRIYLNFYEEDHPHLQLAIKSYFPLKKILQQSSDFHNQGCKNHISALIEAKDGNIEEATRLVGLARSDFEESLRLGTGSAACAEYANFLLKEKKLIGGDSNKNKEKIILLLEKAIELKDDGFGLVYDKQEMSTLSEELQRILKEEIRETNDESASIEVRPVYLAYLLLMKVHLEQENEDEKSNDNRETITNLLTQFREELEQDKAKGDVKKPVIEIGYKLYDHFRSLIPDQENEEELTKPMAQTISEIPSTSSAKANAQKITQENDLGQEIK